MTTRSYWKKRTDNPHQGDVMEHGVTEPALAGRPEVGEHGATENAPSPFTPAQFPLSSPNIWERTPTPAPRSRIVGLGGRVRSLPSEARTSGSLPLVLGDGESLDGYLLDSPMQLATHEEMNNPDPFEAPPGTRPDESPQRQVTQEQPGGAHGAHTDLRTRKRPRVESPPSAPSQSAGPQGQPGLQLHTTDRDTMTAQNLPMGPCAAETEVPPPYGQTAVATAFPEWSDFVQNPEAYPEFHQAISNFLRSDHRAGANIVMDPTLAQQPAEGWRTAEHPWPLRPEHSANPHDVQMAGTSRTGVVNARAETHMPLPHPQNLPARQDWMHAGREARALTGAEGQVAHGGDVQKPGAPGSGPLLDTRRWPEQAHKNPWLERMTAEERRAAKLNYEKTWSSGHRGEHGAASGMRSGWDSRGEARPGRQKAMDVDEGWTEAGTSTQPRLNSGTVFFLPPKTPAAQPNLQQRVDTTGGERTFIEYDRARYLTEARVLKVTLKPSGGFPELHSRDPYDLTRCFAPLTRERWEAVDKEYRCIVQVYGYVDYRSKEAVDRTVATLKDKIGRITGEHTAVFYIADNVRWGDDGEVDPPTAILVKNLSERAVTILVNQRVWSLVGFTFFVHKDPYVVPKFLLGFGGITNPNASVTKDEIRKLFEDDRIEQHLNQVLYSDGIPLDMIKAVRVMMIANLRIEIRPGVGASASGMTFAANVYSDPPPTETPDRWLDLKARICEMGFELPTNLAAYIRPPERMEWSPSDEEAVEHD
ncbi:hypothetical protein PYCCODRAFT_1422985 [Trametes coccinea BRFM310]|uniref:Uncharacterized protein n=1 Tax=Trametes coccinea (strain BRFM310) TaxID=1353009 RepID=A0A1Y2J0U4_TRAC3|nr:hypothetical protein PYCCODRAFT_1422985 [Trametes coccinea BRFM310]